MNTIKKSKMDMCETKRGRPRRFHREDALAKATGVFCEYGYQGTSVAQLTKVMGMNPPSLYGTFGDKEHLFLEVLEHYHAPYKAAVAQIFSDAKNTREAFSGLFKLTESYHACLSAQGCLIVNSGIIRNEESTSIGDKIKALHDDNENMIHKRLKQGQRDGDIPGDVKIRPLSRYINGILQGAAALARGQQSPKAVKDLLTQGFECLERKMTT